MRALDEVVDHRLEAHLHAVVRVIDALYAVLHQRLDFFRGDRAPTAPEHLDVTGTVLLETVDHVAKELVVPALVGTDGDTVCVLLDGRPHDVIRRRIMLIAASCPSNSEAAVTKRSGVSARSPDGRGKPEAAVLMKPA